MTDSTFSSNLLWSDIASGLRIHPSLVPDGLLTSEEIVVLNENALATLQNNDNEPISIHQEESVVIDNEEKTNSVNVDDFEKTHISLESLSENLSCCVCYGFENEARVSLCGHICCVICCSKLKGKPCPICRASWELDKSNNKLLTRLRSSYITVPCSNFKEGCTFRSNYADIKEHLNKKKCLFATRKCNECKLIVKEINIKQHETDECSQRKTTCVHCSQPILVNDLLVHEQLYCLGKPIQCPFCLEHISEGYVALQIHMILCGAKLKQCQFCKKEISNEDLTLHEDTCLEALIECQLCHEKYPIVNEDYHQMKICKKRLEVCMYCQEKITADQLGHHMRECKSKQRLCCFCQMYQTDLDAHRPLCLKMKQECATCHKLILRDDLKSHLEDCNMDDECSKCHLMVPFQDLPEHTAISCLKRQVICCCRKQMTLEAFLIHKETCTKFPFYCDWCHIIIPIRQRKNHLQFVCKYKSHHCPSCELDIPRDEIMRHVNFHCTDVEMCMQPGCFHIMFKLSEIEGNEEERNRIMREHIVEAETIHDKLYKTFRRLPNKLQSEIQQFYLID